MPEKRRREDQEASAIRNYPGLLRRYARLLEVTSELASTLDLDYLLRRVVEVARELTECEASSLLLYDAQTQRLYFEAATSFLMETLGKTTVPTENSIAGWVFRHGEPLLVQDALRDPRFYREVDALTRFQTRSIIGVPLRTKEKTLGVIEAVNKTDGAFDQEDVKILQTLAAQAAIAIENSRLFQQSDLIAEMVHELRTPLAGLNAAANLLQRADLGQEPRKRMVQAVADEVRRLNDMASDFLELARLESGRVRCMWEPVHLGGLVQESLEIIRPQADGEKIAIEVAIDPELTPIQGDRNRLKQVLLNLLTNAIKYNRPGGKVSIALRREADDAVLVVQDTGRGIPQEDLPHIFERFYRVPDPEGAVGGTGLGLAIAKRIVDSHLGRIEVASQPNEGSTFKVRLPSGGSPAGRLAPAG